MVLFCVGGVTSKIKGYHVYNYKYKVGETLIYEEKSTKKHRQNVIAAKKKDQQVIGHVPEALASKLFTLMQEWKIYKVSGTISVEERKAPEGTWVLGGGIEIPRKYFLYGPVIHKTFVRKKLRR